MRKPKVERITFNDELEISSEHKKVIIDTLNLEREPHLLHEGRSPYIQLNKLDLDLIRFNGISSNCLKLKGGGQVIKEDDSMRIKPPNEEIYIGPEISSGQVITMHIGTNENGRIFPIVTRPRVSGGLEFRSGENEYAITRDALARGVSVSLPIAYGKYNIKVCGEEIGFVVLGGERFSG